MDLALEDVGPLIAGTIIVVNMAVVAVEKKGVKSDVSADANVNAKENVVVIKEPKWKR